MKKNILILILIANLFGGNEISLSYCYQKAIANAPQKNTFLLKRKISKNKISNFRNQYYPELNLTGFASYQSDMPKLPIDLPFIKIPDGDKDKYDLSIDLKQLIYDGGIVDALSKSENANNEISKIDNELYLFQRKSKVNSLYFAIIFSKEKLKNLIISQKILSTKKNQINSLINNGLKSEDEMLVFDKEILKLNEKVNIEQNNLKNSIYNLSKYIGTTIEDSTHFLIPKNTVKTTTSKRFEFELFDKKKKYLETVKNISSTSKLPKLFASLKSGYGKPALNLFSNNFDFYYMASIGFKWNIYDFGKISKEKEILNIQNQLIDQNISEFDENLTLALKNGEKQITNYEIMVKTDDELLVISKKIEQKSLTKYTNGIESLTSYIINLNKLFEAENNLKIHKISLIYSKIIYKTINGDI